MPGDRRRILELALAAMGNRKKQLDQDIAEITLELKGAAKEQPAANAQAAPLDSFPKDRKKSRFSTEEKLRRSQRMKTYWVNWRKKKARQK
jgi:hypothetical protein